MQRRNFQTRRGTGGPSRATRKYHFAFGLIGRTILPVSAYPPPMSAHQVTTTPGERLKGLAPFGLGRIKPNRS
jgi:hypothetical protein